VSLRVCDDGIGSSDGPGGFGLIGLRERVQLHGGTVRIDSAPGRGFRLEVEIPL
jgi:signal transduction histidine kinase